MKKLHLSTIGFCLSLIFLLSSCGDPCKGVGCLNNGVCDQGTCLCPEGFEGENCETAILPVFNPELKCGTAWTQNCLDSDWSTIIPNGSEIQLIEGCMEGATCLHLINPHEPNASNPAPLILNGLINDIEEGVGYRISCNVKIEGYPDVTNSPSLAFYAFSNDNWYGQLYYSSPAGILHELDWTVQSYTFVGGVESTLKFELYTVYEQTWITDLKIEKL